ncbi:hypothetical protein AS026_21050 [Rhizobium altiplani]|uniref:Uncharacterized protein n=1 Tax=Rhizobium altiplani TaxID=1864509 RepID=A0A109J4B3_9HYPH|nr:hypothetical protein [Rhizobium altiplani]KWV42100.1 hypothetical protein AS026_21050 [Rhizobium altiplani]
MINLALAKSLLPEARELAGLVSDEWSESYNMKDQRAELCVIDRTTGEVMPIAIITRDCSYDDRRLMIKAPVLVRALLLLLDMAFAEIRRLRPQQQDQSARGERQQQSEKRSEPDYAAECAMKCADQAFRRFLLEKKKAPDAGDPVRVTSHVRYLLKVDSRAELNRDAGARKRWLDLRAEFEVWMREVA